ncbi:MAG TPA: helix-turn-helix domain-containing protein [Balneolales bacterium]|nr:helix-turn-helix domain-containing protein [Balneolales bacterium]
MNDTEDQVVKIAKALSDKTRVQIVRELSKKGKITCTEAGEIADLSQPTMSHHIKILVDAGLLLTEKHGRHVSIWVNRAVVQDFTFLLNNMTTA